MCQIWHRPERDQGLENHNEGEVTTHNGLAVGLENSNCHLSTMWTITVYVGYIVDLNYKPHLFPYMEFSVPSIIKIAKLLEGKRVNMGTCRDQGGFQSIPQTAFP